MPVPMLKVDAETPLLLQGEIEERPSPAPKATSRSAKAAAVTAPAATASQDTPADSVSTIVVGERKSASIEISPGIQ
jgi:hypothetical protein